MIGLRTLLSVVKSKFVKIKDYLLMAAIAIAVAASAMSYSLYNKSVRLDKELGYELSNRKQYQSMMEDAEQDNRVLQLNIGDLKNSNDSLIRSLEETRKSLKTAEKGLKQALAVKTVIRDTIGYLS